MGKPMKRSQINTIIDEAKIFFEAQNFKLPPWAFWTPSDWKGKYPECAEIVDNMLGWDVTPFSSDDFYRRGLLAFTIRNGNLKTDKKTYGEKILIVEENQETPWHFHWSKMEDIIDRGGGNLVIELYGATEDGEFTEENVTVKVDSIVCSVPAGGKVVLEPGQSICLEQGIYHRFYGEPGEGKVMVGEVSSVNDDTEDNRWYENLGRFPGIDEDCEPLHLLATEYAHFL